MEAIISATAAAPDAVLSGVLMMVIMAAILFLGLLPKIGKFVPGQSIAGFLFILGAFVTIPGDGAAAFAGGEPGATVIAAVTMSLSLIHISWWCLRGYKLRPVLSGPWQTMHKNSHKSHRRKQHDRRL